jgi:2,5-diamino-6-(ribosylamino)-4(3H)-pyrimidinone 5'-phosphate reductase
VEISPQPVDRPYVMVFVTATIDGKIASRTRFSSISCPEDLRRLHMARKEAGAVMIGANTANIDDPSLRLKYFEGENPVRIVVDGKLSIREDLRLVREKIARTIILTSQVADRDKIERLKRNGVEVYIVSSREPPKLDMDYALRFLYSIGVKKILVEGGGELIWSLAEKHLIDEIRVTYAGYILGGRDSISIAGGRGFATTSESPLFKPISVLLCKCGREVHIVFKRIDVL